MNKIKNIIKSIDDISGKKFNFKNKYEYIIDRKKLNFTKISLHLLLEKRIVINWKIMK